MNDSIPLKTVDPYTVGTGCIRIGRTAAGESIWKTIWLKIYALTGKAWDLPRNSLRKGSASRWERFQMGERQL